jgi:two-component system CitB family sensor kinase
MSSVITRYVLAILVVTMLLGLSLYSQVTRRLLDQHYEELAVTVAKSVALDPAIRSAMARGDHSRSVATAAEQVRAATGAAYVVVIDLSGVRHSHPNARLIGHKVEEPVVSLDGRTHVGIDAGSLGPSANAKAPLRDSHGRVIGEVSVGFLERDVNRDLFDELPALLTYTGAALVVGVLASLVLARHLKRTTYGLELDEFASLLQEREAMLHGIREGVVAFDHAGRLSMANDEARRLLRMDAAPGTRLEDAVPEGRLRDVLSGKISGQDQMVLTDDQLLAVNRRPVVLNGRDVGAVITLRDRTELEALLRELDSVNGLTDALRAQQHEFSNRLHVLSVLLGLGDIDEAQTYLGEISTSGLGQAEDLRSRIAPASVAALLLAKITIAAERGIALTVTDDSRLDHPGPDPRALPTIVGNLVDNALDAVAETPQPREVEVRLVYDAAQHAIVVEVSDSGVGVAPELVQRVFQDGYTTKDASGGVRRGLGLALVHRLVTRLGGHISVSAGPGATFTVTLPVPVDVATDDQPAVREEVR